jgi:hypothetical protein
VTSVPFRILHDVVSAPRTVAAVTDTSAADVFAYAQKGDLPGLKENKTKKKRINCIKSAIRKSLFSVL